MAILDIFKRKDKKTAESNALFGQSTLGNNILYANANKSSIYNQLLYVTTGSSTQAGRPVDVTLMSRNSTVMACVNTKARTIAQLPICIMAELDDGSFVDALLSDKVGSRDRIKAKQVKALLEKPNNFQTKYEFWYQNIMWAELLGESFTLWWRKDQTSSTQTPLEMYVVDSTLISVTVTPTRYPTYRLSTPAYGFNKEDPLNYYQVLHIVDAAWQGSAGFNKGILAAELVGLDQDIDIYANYVMLNGAKPSGLFSTALTIPDGKFKEIAARLKESWNQMTGSNTTDQSKSGQGMLLDQGMQYTPIKMLTLQDTDASALKLQTMKRICGLFGVPPSMIGIQDQKYNNTETQLDEFYKSSLSPLIENIQQKLKMQLFEGFPNLHVRFDVNQFLKGASLQQMNFATAGVTNGIFTPNEARKYLGYPSIEGADNLISSGSPVQVTGTSPQDTGGGGGNQTNKMNIGTT